MVRPKAEAWTYAQGFEDLIVGGLWMVSAGDDGKQKVVGAEFSDSEATFGKEHVLEFGEQVSVKIGHAENDGLVECGLFEGRIKHQLLFFDEDVGEVGLALFEDQERQNVGHLSHLCGSQLGRQTTP